MKTLLALALFTFSLSSFARDLSCSPYPSETISLIQNARSCDEAAKIAVKCISRSRNDSLLAYSGIQTCEALKGKLTVAQEERRKVLNRQCSVQSGSDNTKALYCMLEALRTL